MARTAGWEGADDADRMAVDGARSADDGTEDGAIPYTRQALASLAPQPQTPTSPRRLRAGIAAAVILPVLAGGALALARRNTTANLRPIPIPALPDCTTPITAQCVQKHARTSSGIQVSFASGDTREYRFGRSADAIRVANFFCGQRATAALYEPDSGLLFYLSGWPDPDSDERLEASVDATGITGATVSIGDHDGNDCADIALDADGMRTWFLPSEQTNRLQRAPLIVEEQSE